MSCHCGSLTKELCWKHKTINYTPRIFWMQITHTPRLWYWRARYAIGKWIMGPTWTDPDRAARDERAACSLIANDEACQEWEQAERLEGDSELCLLAEVKAMMAEKIEKRIASRGERAKVS